MPRFLFISSNLYLNIFLQHVLQILKDVTKTSSWKPGCLAISITSSKPQEPETGTRNRGVLAPVPVNHDVVMEESSYGMNNVGGFLHFLMSKNSAVLTMTKEYKRYKCLLVIFYVVIFVYLLYLTTQEMLFIVYHYYPAQTILDHINISIVQSSIFLD